MFQGKPAVYLSTSPGAGGAANVLAAAVASAPFFGAHVVASLPVPNFQDNFDRERGKIVDPAIRRAVVDATAKLSGETATKVA